MEKKMAKFQKGGCKEESQEANNIVNKITILLIIR